MATPASNSVCGGTGSGMTSNPFSGDHSIAATCLDDPNFATICSFIQNFGEIVRIGHVPFDDLQQWLENTVDVPLPLVQLHLILLRRVFKTVSVDKWERSLAKFGHMYCSQDAWEIERFGYKKAKIQTKLNILKNLCEAQFDFNVKFKAEVNKLQATDLRLTPLGRDTEGQLYWYQVDADANLRVYREDIDDETWEMVASTRDELVALISQLQRGEVRKPEPEAIILPEEDSNSKDEISPKEIILDTGKVEEEEEEEEESSEQDSQQSGDSDEKRPAEVKKVEPLLLRNVFNKSKLQPNQVTIVDNSAPDSCKEDGRNSDNLSETKPGIKLVFGMKSKPSLETLFPPPPHLTDQEMTKKDQDSNLDKPSSDQTDLSRLEETVAKLSERHFQIVPKSEPVNERTTKSDITKDMHVREVEVQNMNENAMDAMECNLIAERVSPKGEQVSSARGHEKTKTAPTPKIQFNKKDSLKEDAKEANVKVEVNLKDTQSQANKVQVVTAEKIEKSAIQPAKAPPTSIPQDQIQKDQSRPSIQEESLNLEAVIKPEHKEVVEAAPAVEPERITAQTVSEINKEAEPISVSITTEGSSAIAIAPSQDDVSSEIPPVETNSTEKDSTAVVTPPSEPHLLPSDTEQKMPFSSGEPRVPKSEGESNKPDDPIDPTPVVEEVVQKTEAWVCGKDKEPVPVEEPTIKKEDAWVCGNAPTSKEESQMKGISNSAATETDRKGQTDQRVDVSNEKSKSSEVVVHLERSESDDAPIRSDRQPLVTDLKAVESSPNAKLTASLVLYPDSSESSNDACNDDPVPKAVTTTATRAEKDSKAGGTESDPPSSENANQVPSHNQDIEKPKETEGRSSSEAATGDLKEGNNGKTESELKCTIDDLTPSEAEATEKEAPTIENKEPVEESIKVTKSLLDSTAADEARNKVTIENPSNSSPLEKVERVAPSPPPSTTTEVVPSTEEDTSLTPSAATKSVESTGKRKAKEDIESSAKVPRLDESKETKKDDVKGPLPPASPTAPFNPIVGETIEEEVMTITGVGSGALNEGSNENSPVPLAAADVPGSQDESMESDDESRDAFPSSRGRGGRRGRGRGRRGRPPGIPSGGRNKQASSAGVGGGGSRGGAVRGGLREVARLGVSLDVVEVNGENDRPVRASRRIAQIRLKEEEERRQLEEERLAQLKAAQMQKKAKQLADKDKKGASPAVKTPGKKGPGRKSFKEGQHLAQDYIPEDVSESEDNSEEEEEEDGSDDQFAGKLGKKKKLRKKKNGKPLGKKPGSRPWATSSDEDDEEAVEEEEEYHYEEEEEELVFKSDHEFSPESDLGEDADAPTSRHARTAKQDKGDLFEEGNCCKCRKGDHPEWILLCDKCDKGWHASCLRPQLWVIPEGEWFCPPCQHNMLIEKLSNNLVEYEVLLKKRENEILRKQRLAYVGISLDNVLPDKEKPEENEAEPEQEERRSSHHHHERKKQRRRILLSDEDELSDDFINDRSDGRSSRSNSTSGSDEPTYRLRARRTKKAFNFQEYDEMINSALRVDDDEEGGEEMEVEGDKADGVEEDPEDDASEQKLNGEEPEPHVGGGKNDAYLKHLEEQAQEVEDETDEELLDEKERLRRRELKKGSHRKTRRRINDLEAYSEEEDSDDDFKASEAEDDEEEGGEEGESEWSGDKMEEDSDDSIAKRARRKERHGRLGRREKYSDKGVVRRSTRKRRSRISYDESDEEEEDEDQTDKWQSDEESEEEAESSSESDDDTWGRRKKKPALVVPKSSFFSGESSSSTKGKGKGKGGVKRKKRKTDEDDVDRAWNNSARSKKEKDEVVERKTRGRKINFKDILDSGESDDEGNVRPKRRPLSDSDDSRSPSSSRKLAEEIRAENARQEKEYEERKTKMGTSSDAPTSKSEEEAEKKTEGSDSPATLKPIKSDSNGSSGASVNDGVAVAPQKVAPSPVAAPPLSSPSPMASPPSDVASPISLPPSSSPVSSLHLSSALIPPPPLTSTVGKPPSLSPVHIPPPSSVPLLSSAPVSLTSLFSAPPPIVLQRTSHTAGIPFPITSSALGLQLGPHPSKGVVGMIPIIPPVPAATPPILEKKSKSKGSRRSKSEKQPQPVPAPMELELALSSGKPMKGSPSPSPPAPVIKSSSKKQRDKESSASPNKPIHVPNPALLMSGGGVSLPEMLVKGIGIHPPIRSGGGSTHTSGSTREKKSSGGNSTHHHGKRDSSRASNPSQQTTPPPVSQNLSPTMPIDIDRVPNPALFQGNPGMRPFHPMWVRNPGPLPGYGGPGSPVPPSLGKPPPLNTSPFTGQQGPPSRPGFLSPPPLRIPNPNTSPLQAFQHFKRDGGGHLASQLYRLPPGQPQPLANILPPGMMSPHAAGAERFFGPPSAYGHPYGLLPPHSQGQHPQSLFPYDYRPPDAPPPPFKEEPLPPRTSSSSLPTPVSSASSSPPPAPPTTSSSSAAAVPLSASAKEDGPSEFGGLVSYFSSQRSEEDMDT